MSGTNDGLPSVKEEIVTNSEQTEQETKKKLIIGIPGDRFSSKFLVAWTSLLNTLWASNKYEVIVSPGVSSFVPFARMHTLGVNVLKGIDQKPFDGIDFDIWVTIDSDIVFSPTNFIDLVESLTEERPVVAALYKMADIKHYAVVKNWNVDYFAENGTFEFLTDDNLKKWKEENEKDSFMRVAYTGMGFMAVSKNVLYNMTYPYFNGDLHEIKGKDGKYIRDLMSEDVCFCKNINKIGHDIYINTNIRVGHEKAIVI